MDDRSHPLPEPLPPLRCGLLELSSRYWLAPLAGYTNLSFRRIVRELGGVGLATTDLVNAQGLLTGSSRSLRIIETCPEDRPLAVQIFGNDASVMADAAVWLQERDVDAVDINMGCPVARVLKGGAGASLMCRVDDAISLVRRVVESVRIPVTVKMRLGWDSRQLTAPRLAREFEQLGVAAVTVHGRTREQRFRGTVDLDGIRQTVEAVESMPIVGNGDVRSIADAARMLQTTGCRGISVGRGGLANPWIFRQLTEWETTGRWGPSGSFEDRMQLLLRQFRFLEEERGIENAIVTFRKIAHWHLKGMGVQAGLRSRFQLAKTRAEFEAALQRIAQADADKSTRAQRPPIPDTEPHTQVSQGEGPCNTSSS